MMKRLSEVGASMWDGALALLACAAFILVCGIIAYWIYVAVQWLGFSDQAAQWSTIISIVPMGVLFYRISRDTLVKWTLNFLGWTLIAVVILAIGFAVFTVVISPPSLYSLVVVGLILLAGILWQLTKLTSKR